MAGALVSAKLNIPLIHLEAGCRSFNKKMPEELNRILCDHYSDLLIATDNVSKKNLLREGIPEKKISVVGSTAIEAVLRNVTYVRNKSTIFDSLGLEKNKYVRLTIHRAENTDSLEILQGLVDSVNHLADKYNNKIKFIFPLHPRTRKKLEESSLKLSKYITVVQPQGYLNFLSLLDNCLFVMSDSGGIQEEAAALNKPCLILRNETEWTYLTDLGKNKLIGNNKELIIKEVTEVLQDRSKLENMKQVSLDLNVNIAEKIVEVIKNA